MFKRILHPANLLALLLPPLVIWGGYFIYLSVVECIRFDLPVLYLCFAGLGCTLYLYRRHKDHLQEMLPPEFPGIVGVLIFQPLYFLAMRRFFDLHAHATDYELIRQYFALPASTVRIAALDGTLFALPLSLLVMYLSGLWLSHRQRKSIFNADEDKHFRWLPAVVRVVLIIAYLAGAHYMIIETGGPKVTVFSHYDGVEVEFKGGRVFSGIMDSYDFISIIATPDEGMESPITKKHLAGFLFLFDINNVDAGKVTISNIRLLEAGTDREISLVGGQSDRDVMVDGHAYRFYGVTASGEYSADFNEGGRMTLFIYDAFVSEDVDLELHFDFKLESDEFTTEQSMTVTPKRRSPRYVRFTGALRVLSVHSEDACTECLTLDD